MIVGWKETRDVLVLERSFDSVLLFESAAEYVRVPLDSFERLVVCVWVVVPDRVALRSRDMDVVRETSFVTESDWLVVVVGVVDCRSVSVRVRLTEYVLVKEGTLDSLVVAE